MVCPTEMWALAGRMSPGLRVAGRVDAGDGYELGHSSVQDESGRMVKSVRHVS